MFSHHRHRYCSLVVMALFIIIVTTSLLMISSSLFVNAFIFSPNFPSLYNSFVGRNDFYEVLEISRSASDKDINKAFRRMTRVWHPDTSKHENAKEKYSTILMAKAVLLDEEKRKMYDWFGIVEGESSSSSTSDNSQDGNNNHVQNDQKRNKQQTNNNNNELSLLNKAVAFFFENVVEPFGDFADENFDENGNPLSTSEDDEDEDEDLPRHERLKRKRERERKQREKDQRKRERQHQKEQFRIPPEAEERIIRISFILLVHAIDIFFYLIVARGLILMIIVGVLYFGIRR